MEIASGTIILSPENKQHKRDITPAEALILHKLHFKNANGSPLGPDFVVTGEAVTVDVPYKPATESEFLIQTGKTIPATPAVPAKTHKRTNREEVTRLKKKYTGTVKLDGGGNALVFSAVFGSVSMPKLPETFDEIEEAVGMVFPPMAKAPVEVTEETHQRNELLSKTRVQLVGIALENKLMVDISDDNVTIVNNIMEARSAKAPVKSAPTLQDPMEELRSRTRATLNDLCILIGVETSTTDNKGKLVELILAKVANEPDKRKIVWPD